MRDCTSFIKDLPVIPDMAARASSPLSMAGYCGGGDGPQQTALAAQSEVPSVAVPAERLHASAESRLSNHRPESALLSRRASGCRMVAELASLICVSSPSFLTIPEVLGWPVTKSGVCCSSSVLGCSRCCAVVAVSTNQDSRSPSEPVGDAARASSEADAPCISIWSMPSQCSCPGFHCSCSCMCKTHISNAWSPMRQKAHFHTCKNEARASLCSSSALATRRLKNAQDSETSWHQLLAKQLSVHAQMNAYLEPIIEPIRPSKHEFAGGENLQLPMFRKIGSALT